MSHTFIAYIDESGDDGLRKYREPGSHGGASKWLVISALVIRLQKDLESVSWRDSITAKMPEKRKRNLHFAELNHGQKLLTAKHLAEFPVRGISVLSHKPTIQDGVYTEKNQLYFYVARYLIERISWLCRDYRPKAPEGDGRVKIVFSRRGGMQYGDFRDYMMRLRGNIDEDIRIHWPVIDIEGIAAQDHSMRAGLQLADSLASSVAYGIEPDRYGNCESRYVEILKPIIYQRRHNYLSYGMKFVSQIQSLELSADQRKMVDLFK